MINSHRSVLFLTYWGFDDPLVQAYVLPYVERIRTLVGNSPSFYLVTLEREAFREALVTIDSQASIINYRIRYQRFGISALLNWCYQLWRLLNFCRVTEVSVVHAWCTPAGGVGYFLSRILGVPLVLDSYEPHADAMVEAGVWRRWGLAYNLLVWLERQQTLRASYIIAASAKTPLFALQKYGTGLGPIFVKPSGVDSGRFSPTLDKSALRERLGLPPGTLMVYAGKFGGMYFEEEIFEFAAHLKRFHFSDLSFLVLSSTPFSALEQWTSKFEFPVSSLVLKHVGHGLINNYLSAADFAITPVRPVPSKLYCSPLKNPEYWSCGLPVVISPGISTDSEDIEKNKLGVICYFDDPTTYDAAALDLRKLLSEECQSVLQRRIREFAVMHRSYERVGEVYGEIYSDLPFFCL